jgi:DnaB-like helicase C terminal domain
MAFLVQVSRAFESRPTRRLQLSDLRDGSLENDADLVIFLSLAEGDVPETTNAPRLVTISIAKNRNGPRANLDVCFLPSVHRFCDWPTLPQPTVPQQPPIQANQPTGHLPRLQEIMARTAQRWQLRSANPQRPPVVKRSEQSRVLPIGAVLEDEEEDVES